MRHAPSTRPLVLNLATWCCLALLLVGMAACADGSETGKSNKPDPEPVEIRSPLGVEYPNPLAVVRRVMGNMEKGDWRAACADLADLGRNGRPVPLVPGENVPKDLDKGVKERIRPFFRHFRGVNAPWVKISYGAVEIVRNDPPTIRVPIRWDYDLASASDRDKEVLMHAYKKQVGGQAVTWNDVVMQMRREVMIHERRKSWPTWTFSWLQDHWRLYIGRPLR